MPTGMCPAGNVTVQLLDNSNTNPISHDSDIMPLRSRLSAFPDISPKLLDDRVPQSERR